MINLPYLLQCQWHPFMSLIKRICISAPVYFLRKELWFVLRYVLSLLSTILQAQSGLQSRNFTCSVRILQVSDIGLVLSFEDWGPWVPYFITSMFHQNPLSSSGKEVDRQRTILKLLFYLRHFLKLFQCFKLAILGSLFGKKKILLLFGVGNGSKKTTQIGQKKNHWHLHRRVKTEYVIPFGDFVTGPFYVAIYWCPFDRGRGISKWQHKNGPVTESQKGLQNWVLRRNHTDTDRSR